MNPNTPTRNPYFQLPIRFDAQKYYGSRDMIQKICNIISLSNHAPVEVTGLPGMGKTSLLKYLSDPQGAFLQEREYLQSIYQNEPERLFPIRVDFKVAPRDWSAFQIILQRLLEEYPAYTARTHNPALLPLPKLATLPEQTSAEDAPTLLEKIFRELKEKGVRPVLLLDNFDLKFGEMKYNETTLMRPWREQVSFVICAEKPLHEVNVKAAGSPFFVSSKHLFMNGLGESEIERLIREPSAEVGIILPEQDSQFICDLVGNHPYMLITACQQLFDLRAELGILKQPGNPLDEEERANLKISLKTAINPYFDLLLSRLKPELVDVLRLTAGQGASIQLDDTLRIRLVTLTNFALVKRLKLGSKTSYQPFSFLFQEYLKEEKQKTLRPSSEKSIKVGRLEKKLLDYLMAHQDSICTFAMLSQDIWEIPFDPDSAMRGRIQTSVSRLRDKLRLMEEYAHIEFITIRDEGYKVILKAQA